MEFGNCAGIHVEASLFISVWPRTFVWQKEKLKSCFWILLYQRTGKNFTNWNWCLLVASIMRVFFIRYYPTFLHSLEGVVPINKFNRDGDLLCLQDLVVQIQICHCKTKHLVIFPWWFIKDGACWQGREEKQKEELSFSVIEHLEWNKIL